MKTTTLKAVKAEIEKNKPRFRGLGKVNFSVGNGRVHQVQSIEEKETEIYIEFPEIRVIIDKDYSYHNARVKVIDRKKREFLAAWQVSKLDTEKLHQKILEAAKYNKYYRREV